jgi:hypothetical protein
VRSASRHATARTLLTGSQSSPGSKRPLDRKAEFLVDVLLHALRKIPASGAAWSWGEFHNGGLTPLYAVTEDDWRRLILSAVDLGLDKRVPATTPGATPTPREALAGNLLAATEQMLTVVRGLLEAAGVSPYGTSSSEP